MFASSRLKTCTALLSGASTMIEVSMKKTVRIMVDDELINNTTSVKKIEITSTVVEPPWAVNVNNK